MGIYAGVWGRAISGGGGALINGSLQYILASKGISQDDMGKGKEYLRCFFFN